MKRYRTPLLVFLLLSNLLIIFFFLIGCDYFKLMSREDWEKNNNVENNLYLYVLLNNKTIDIYKINYDEEKISKNYNVNIMTSGINIPYDIISEVNNDYLYASGGTGSVKNLSVFKINESGELNELLDKSIVSKTDAPFLFTSNKIKNYLYIYNHNQYKLTSLKLNHNSGLLSEIESSPFGTGCLVNYTNPDSFLVDKNENFLYFVCFDWAPFSKGFIIYKIGSNGTLTVLKQIPLPPTVYLKAIVLHPSGNFLYTGNSSAVTNTLYIYLVNKENGDLIPTNDSPYILFPSLTPVSKDIISIACHPNGKFLYIGSASITPRVYIYKINEETGNLVEYSYIELPGGYEPDLIKIDESGKFLFLVNRESSQSIHIYKIDNGYLREITNSPISGFVANVNDIDVVFKKKN